MDKNLDFLIPRSDIDKVNIVEMLNEWERKMFSQEPKKYSFLSNVFFYEQTNMEYYKGMVEDELDINQYIALCLEGIAFLNWSSWLIKVSIVKRFIMS